MNDDLLADFKQFITVTVSQQISDMDSKFEAKFKEIETKLDRLEQKVDDGFAGIAEIADRHATQLDNHETRITSLEGQSA